MALTDKQNTFLKRYLSVDLPEIQKAGDRENPAVASADPNDLASMKQRLAALATSLKSVEPSPERTQVVGDMRALTSDLASRPPSEAGAELERLEHAARELQGMPRATFDASALRQIFDLWVQAKDRSDGEIEKLRLEMAASGNTACEKLAEKGFAHITEQRHVRLMASLTELRSVKPKDLTTALNKAQSAAGDLRQTLAANKPLKIMENNPFGLKLAIAAPLIDALTRIEKILNQAQAAA